MASLSRLSEGARILVSGGGIAGLTLAYWLDHYGFRPTVIEQAAGLRPEGYGIEFSGSGWDVAEQMGLVRQLQQHKLTVPYFLFKDISGKTHMRLQMGRFFQAVQDKMVQIMRPNLQAILYEALGERVPVHFARSIQAIEQSDQALEVQFQDGGRESFDLLLGADGLHSQVRRLVFGEERQFSRYMGYYFATFFLPKLEEFEESACMHLDRDRQAMVYPDGRGGYVALLVFRAPDQGVIPVGQRKAFIERYYRGSGWVIPDMIASLRDDSTLYLDALSQIEMPTWARGRVAVVGDAAYCPTLLSGMGASLAMGGAYVLAQELARNSDYRAAFAAYQARTQPFIAQKQRSARRFAATFVPSNRFTEYLSYLTMYLILAPILTPFVSKRIGTDSLLRVA